MLQYKFHDHHHTHLSETTHPPPPNYSSVWSGLGPFCFLATIRRTLTFLTKYLGVQVTLAVTLTFPVEAGSKIFLKL